MLHILLDDDISDMKLIPRSQASSHFSRQCHRSGGSRFCVKSSGFGQAEPVVWIQPKKKTAVEAKSSLRCRRHLERPLHRPFGSQSTQIWWSLGNPGNPGAPSKMGRSFGFRLRTSIFQATGAKDWNPKGW